MKHMDLCSSFPMYESFSHGFYFLCGAVAHHRSFPRACLSGACLFYFLEMNSMEYLDVAAILESIPNTGSQKSRSRKFRDLLSRYSQKSKCFLTNYYFDSFACCRFFRRLTYSAAAARMPTPATEAMLSPVFGDPPTRAPCAVPPCGLD